MANSRANAANWVFGEILTEGQINQIDENQARSVDGRAGQLQIETHSVTRRVDAQPVWRTSLDGDLLLSDPWRVATLSTNSVEFWWPVKVPNGAIITGWSVTVRGDSGHSALPSSKPIVRLRVDGIFVADSSVDAAAYDSEHTISRTGVSATVDTTNAHNCYFEINTESGANSRSGTQFYAPTVTFLVSKLDEG